LQGASHSGCTNLKVEVEKAQLEVELVTPGVVRLWRPWVLGFSCEQGISSRGHKTFQGVEECITCLVGLPKKTKGNWRQVNLKENRFDPSGELKRLWCRLVELPKILL